MLSSITTWLLYAAVAFAANHHYTLELTWDVGEPDGHEREMIFINGDYPGPLLEAQQGDWMEVEVYNALPFNTTIHFHGKRPDLVLPLVANVQSGIHQTGTPWADGVPGLTQRPIQPGATYTYRWLTDSYGSYFYHAHTRGQIDDGAYGPIRITPKPGIAKPFGMISEEEVELLEEAEAAVQPVLLTDWRHRTSEQTWKDQVASGIESAICMDSLLVNGKGAVECWPREEIDANVDPSITPILKSNGLKLTDKGYITQLACEHLLTTTDAFPRLSSNTHLARAQD